VEEDKKRCYFCIAHENFVEHLVSSIGEHSYLALPKGPLTTSQMYSSYGVTCPSNIIISPTEHAKSVATLVVTETGQNVSDESYIEMTKFKTSLQNMISKASNGTLGAVIYEFSIERNIHVHWQFVAVDRKYTAADNSTGKSLVETAFRVEAENCSYPSFQVRDPGLGRGESEFFRVWIWTPSTENPLDGVEQCITMPIRNSFDYEGPKFFQFGRIVLSKLLGLESRTSWQKVLQSVEEETADAKLLREAFEEFDFSRT